SLRHGCGVAQLQRGRLVIEAEGRPYPPKARGLTASTGPPRDRGGRQCSASKVCSDLSLQRGRLVIEAEGALVDRGGGRAVQASPGPPRGRGGRRGTRRCAAEVVAMLQRGRLVIEAEGRDVRRGVDLVDLASTGPPRDRGGRILKRAILKGAILLQ